MSGCFSSFPLSLPLSRTISYSSFSSNLDKPPSRSHPVMSSFLSDAKARLQHTNKLPFAPKDIRNLADVISSEKAVINSSARFSIDLRKSADALKEWGLAEGDDLGDILPKLSILLGHLADAQARFSDHDGTYRIHFKSIRMREEGLTALKKSKEAVQAKIATLEKKIAKLSSENKELPVLTGRLQEARSDHASLEQSVSVEEARLSDFKRETVREGLGLRLGAMLELAEKMTIVCELGKMLVAEVPLDRTAPGAVRASYYGGGKTQSIVDEAQRCLTQVIFNPTPSAGVTGIDMTHEHDSSESPSSERLITPGAHQGFRHHPSSTLPTELPPLYFSSGANQLKDDQTPPSLGETPNNPYATMHFGDNAKKREQFTTSVYNSDAPGSQHTLQSVHSGKAPRRMPSRDSSAPHSRAAEDSTSASLPPSRARTDTLVGSVSSAYEHAYSEHAFYVRGPDGAPVSTGPGNPTETRTEARTSQHPSDAGEGGDQQLNLPRSQGKRSMSNASYTYVPTLDMPSYPSSAQQRSRLQSDPTGGEPEGSRRGSASQRHSSLTSRAAGPPGSEGRMTSAGAFRRAAGSSSLTRAPSSLAQIRGPDGEDLDDENQSTVQPLLINKRDRSPNPSSSSRQSTYNYVHRGPPSVTSSSDAGFGQHRYVTNLE